MRNRAQLPSWLSWLTLGVLATWLIYHLVTLLTYPTVWCDEATYANAAAGLLKTGRFILPIHGDVVGFGRNFSTAGRLYTLGMSAVLAILKTGLWQARLYSLLAWCASVALIYLIGRVWYDPPTGAVAALIYGVGFETYIRAHIVRPDTWAIAAVLLEIYLFQQAKRRPTAVRLALTGLVGMLAVDVYWNAIHFGLAVALLVVVDFGLRRRRLDLVAAYALGGLLGVVYFVAAHAYPDPQAAYNQWFVFLPARGYAPTSRLRLSSYWLLAYFWQSDRGLPALQTLLALMGGALAAWRRRPADRELVTITVISWAAFAILFPDQNWTQVGAWLPFLALLIARGAGVAAEVIARHAGRFRLPQRTPPVWMVVLVTPWLVINLAAGVYIGYSYREHKPLAYLRSIQPYIQPEESGVLGHGLWWFGIPESDFTHFFALEHALAYEQDDGMFSSEEAARWMAAHGVDYIVWEAGFECSYSPLVPPGVTMEELLAAYCEPVGAVKDPFYSPEDPSIRVGGNTLPTTVYRCDWRSP